LAKLANHVAKTAERKPGSYPAEHAQVCNLAILPEQDLADIFQATEVGDVWGVGRKIAEQLQAGGVHTVLDLVRMDLATVRRRWSVVLERTVRELQGMPCMPLDDQPQPSKQIACTRSFGRTILDLPPLLEAVSSFATRAAEKLREQGSYAGAVLVFVHTSPFRPGPHYSRSITIPLRRPTADTAHLVRAAVAGMQRIYSPGYELTKAGVMLLDLAPSTMVQGELGLEVEEGGRDRSRLMGALDALNARFGKGTVQMASAGVGSAPKEWAMRQERRTPHYTTCWADMPVARA
jgi:DNA polymerase V